MKRKDKSVGIEYAAPWVDHGAEYGPLSPRTGRMVAQSTAEREYDETFGAVDSPGLWDHDTEEATRLTALAGRPDAKRWPHKVLGRYDEAQMLEYAERHGSELTTREWELVKMFWEGRLSYGVIARRIGVDKERIREGVKRLRGKIRGGRDGQA